MIVTDQEGTELPSLEAAREHALNNAREMACAEVLEGHLNLKHRIDVADEGGTVLFTLQFRDTVEIQT